MTPAEYIQLKAFARIDGALLALLWIVSFASYILGLSNPLFTLVAVVLMVSTPFFVAIRLKKFRDEGLGGFISLARAWGYSAYVFFYASVLLALVQYVYFAFIDQGYIMQTFSKMLSTPESKIVIEQYGMQQTINESLEQMGQQRPIDYALNMLTMNISIGIVLGLPIAALMKRTPQRNDSSVNS